MQNYLKEIKFCVNEEDFPDVFATLQQFVKERRISNVSLATIYSVPEPLSDAKDKPLIGLEKIIVEYMDLIDRDMFTVEELGEHIQSRGYSPDSAGPTMNKLSKKGLVELFGKARYKYFKNK